MRLADVAKAYALSGVAQIVVWGVVMTLLGMLTLWVWGLI